jgi:hypothetical protein
MCRVSRSAMEAARRGFDVDICKSIAAAIFGDDKIAFKPIDTVENFLKIRDIDLVLRGLTWTSGREVAGALRFGRSCFMTAQGISGAEKLGIDQSRRAFRQDDLRVDGRRLSHRSAQLFPHSAPHAESRGEGEERAER